MIQGDELRTFSVSFTLYATPFLRRSRSFVMIETPVPTRKCTNCSRGPQPLSEFVSAKDASVLVRRCAKCRAKDSKQKKRPEVREKCYARARDKKYSAKHAEKKRAEDPEAYRACRAEYSAKFREHNPGYMSAWKKNKLSMRVSITKTCAKKRGIEMNMTDDEITSFICGFCAYCGKASERGDFNGVDRIDSTKAYDISNVVSCCGACNRMKSSLDPVTFVDRCKHISGVEDHAEAWPPSGPGATICSYKYWAKRKNLAFEISEDDFEGIRFDACRYCRRKPLENERFGVDRLDNSLGYVEGNCVTACSECNYMKSSYIESEFLKICSTVARVSPNVSVEYSGQKCLYSMPSHSKPPRE